MVKALRGWKKESGTNFDIFRNEKNPSLTFEIHKFDPDDAPGGYMKYYAFPALNGKGIPNSPALVEKKSEAVKIAKRYMKTGDMGDY
jgi:hypothetical protein